MAEIEFENVVGQIQQTAERERSRQEQEDGGLSPDRLRRMMREERERACRLAERLRP